MTRLALNAKKISKTFPNGFKALDEVSLEVNEGDFYALLGANGAGKSTLINIICNLAPADKLSKVEIFGYDLIKQSFQAKRLIGMMPQEINLAGFEKVKNILFYQAGYYGINHKKARYRTDELLEKIQLSDKKESISLELSGGMKRRLMVARALIHNPKLLILDEPTAGVDVEHRKQMWEFIKEINEIEKTTIILTTHYLEEAESLCKNMSMIHQGKVVRTGKMTSLLKKIGSEYLIVTTEQNLDENQINAIQNMQWLDENTVKYKKNKNQSISEVCQIFTENQLDINDIKPDQNRLESLFFDLVGNKQNS